MKKLLGILVLGLLWCNVGFALTQQSAIEQFLSDRKLEHVEGVWLTSYGAVYITYKQGSTFYSMVIRSTSGNSKSGEVVGEVKKGSRFVYYGYSLTYDPSGNAYQCKSTITLSSPYERREVCQHNKGGWDISSTRLWPEDFRLHNAKFKEPKKPPKDPKPPKEPKQPDDNKIVAASSGTGFFVSNTGHIISNHHVIEGCNTVKLTYNGKEIEVDVLAVDRMNDLAILKANLSPSKVYPVATEDASLLEDIIIAGFPLGKKVSAAIKTSKGSVTSLAGYGDNFSEFQTDAALNQGNSGGPIINQKGNVVGVAVAAYGKKQGIESFNFGIKSSTLKTFANSNGLKFQPPNYRDLSNKDLGQLITNATVYLECYMTVAKIKKMIAEANNRKAFFSEYR